MPYIQSVPKLVCHNLMVHSTGVKVKQRVSENLQGDSLKMGNLETGNSTLVMMTNDTKIPDPNVDKVK